jgi:hypothetical protein
MNEKLVEEIANAVLYEGYMLYPYRPSSVKNRQRWNFGVVYPKGYSDAQKGTDPWQTFTECLVAGTAETCVKVKVRFLQAILRVTKEGEATATGPADSVGQSWQEGTERAVTTGAVPLERLVKEAPIKDFALPASSVSEPARDQNSAEARTTIRTTEDIAGRLVLSAVQLKDDLYKLTLHLSNETGFPTAAQATRDQAIMKSLLSAHSILSVESGEFVSLLETPEEFKEFAAQCKNVGTWPVLVGEDGQRDAMLSSPIILYDYPQIAPESAGDLFDGTEIDEILALRILTLTEDEKAEMRQGDDRARLILERTEALPEEQFLKLHGVLRGMRPMPGDSHE